MSGERFLGQMGTTEGPRPDDDRLLGCLTETAIQGVADGTLRGPERMLAEQHCAECPRCSAELTAYSALAHRLSRLQDPLPPADFTAAVLAAVGVRELARSERRRSLLAALPAAVVALGVLLAWAFLLDPTQRIHDIAVGAATFGRVVSAAGAVVEAVRFPLALMALGVAAAVLAALSRALGRMRVPARIGP